MNLVQVIGGWTGVGVVRELTRRACHYLNWNSWLLVCNGRNFGDGGIQSWGARGSLRSGHRRSRPRPRPASSPRPSRHRLSRRRRPPARFMRTWSADGNCRQISQPSRPRSFSSLFIIFFLPFFLLFTFIYFSPSFVKVEESRRWIQRTVLMITNLGLEFNWIDVELNWSIG